MYVYKRGTGWVFQNFKRLEFEIYDRDGKHKYRLICENRPAEKGECAYIEIGFEGTANVIAGWDADMVLNDMRNPQVNNYGPIANSCVYWVEEWKDDLICCTDGEPGEFNVDL